jgi:hypothetical protein
VNQYINLFLYFVNKIQNNFWQHTAQMKLVSDRTSITQNLLRESWGYCFWSLPYEGVLWRGLPGSPQDTNITDGCLCRVPGDELDAESPLPEGLLLCGTEND